jgi:tRNA pseudouridine55 synthase
MPSQANLVICVDKPEGPTSREVVDMVKQAFHADKAGHAGSLDPIATGLLIVCLNRATRLASFFSDLNKTYEAVLCFGLTTDSFDRTGTITTQSDEISITEKQLLETLKSFEGKQMQTPPMFSAKKRQGKPLYKLARKGLVVERQPVEITIESLTLTAFAPPYASLTTTCSKGTYIRSLCHDIGQSLGVGATMTALRRSAIGHFAISQASTLQQLESQAIGVYSMDKALSWIPSITVQPDALPLIKNGVPLKYNHLQLDGTERFVAGDLVKLLSLDSQLLAIADFVDSPDYCVKMSVVFN